MTKQRKPLPRLLAWLILLFLIAVVVVGPELFPGNSKLYDAIEVGDVQAARAILESGNDPDGRSRGLDPTETERYKYTPLHFGGTISGQYKDFLDPEIIAMLEEAGAK